MARHEWQADLEELRRVREYQAQREQATRDQYLASLRKLIQHESAKALELVEQAGLQRPRSRFE